MIERYAESSCTLSHDELSRLEKELLDVMFLCAELKGFDNPVYSTINEFHNEIKLLIADYFKPEIVEEGEDEE